MNRALHICRCTYHIVVDFLEEEEQFILAIFILSFGFGWFVVMAPVIKEWIS